MYRPVRITGHFANAGDKTTRHAHDRAHRTGVDEGAVLLRMWDIRDESVEIVGRLTAGCHATVPAEWKHEIEALGKTQVAAIRAKMDGYIANDTLVTHENTPTNAMSTSF